MFDLAGEARVSKAAAQGMITLRGAAAVLSKIAKALGPSLPDPLTYTQAGSVRLAWMSPDELLAFCAPKETEALIERALVAIGSGHGAAIDVSEARVMYDITGAEAEKVIAKLCPFDRRGFTPGMIRRTRIAQVAGAVMAEAEGYRVLGFRSVEDYLTALLENAAR
ncbi:MAG: sarcosine oxidase subunit gamma [Maritimibacter sp.]